jgi:hypothetical protein
LRTIDAQCFDFRFAMFPRGLRLMIGATRLTFFALVQAEKNMVFVIAGMCHA